MKANKRSSALCKILLSGLYMSPPPPPQVLNSRTTIALNDVNEHTNVYNLVTYKIYSLIGQTFHSFLWLYIYNRHA